MITGFNTDVRHEGVVFHVQTEDKGLRNPKVETLVYQGGTILHARRTSYSEVVHIDCLPEVVSKLMEEQHHRVIQDIRSGRFDQPETDPARSAKDKTLDELILDYFASRMTAPGP